jgi:hypothetical protein
LRNGTLYAANYIQKENVHQNTGEHRFLQVALKKQNTPCDFLFNSLNLTYLFPTHSCLDAWKWFANLDDKWFLFKFKNDTFVLR